MADQAPRTCGMCGKPMDQPGDPLSGDCAGDCWGCISEIEAEGFSVSADGYRRDHDQLWAKLTREADEVAPEVLKSRR